MKSMRQLNRELAAIVRRVALDGAAGKDPDPGDLVAMRDAVDAILERLRERK